MCAFVGDSRHRVLARSNRYGFDGGKWVYEVEALSQGGVGNLSEELDDPNVPGVNDLYAGSEDEEHSHHHGNRAKGLCADLPSGALFGEMAPQQKYPNDQSKQSNYYHVDLGYVCQVIWDAGSQVHGPCFSPRNCASKQNDLPHFSRFFVILTGSWESSFCASIEAPLRRNR